LVFFFCLFVPSWRHDFAKKSGKAGSALPLSLAFTIANAGYPELANGEEHLLKK